MTQSPTPRLRYFGTDLEVLPGDRVELRTLFLRRRRLGRVACIPARTGRELAALGKDPEDWLIKLDSVVITGWLYSPEDLQPPARLLLLARSGGTHEVVTNAEVEAEEIRIEANASWLELALPPLVLALLGLAVLGLWVWLRS